MFQTQIKVSIICLLVLCLIKAVLESKWPTGTSATGYQLWMKLRNVVQAVAQFRSGLVEHQMRRHSIYSNSETESYTDDGQSVDSYLDATTVDSVTGSMVKSTSSTILIENSLRQKSDAKAGVLVNAARASSANCKPAPSEELASTGTYNLIIY